MVNHALTCTFAVLYQGIREYFARMWMMEGCTELPQPAEVPGVSRES